jgi:hypothetical protein
MLLDSCFDARPKPLLSNRCGDFDDRQVACLFWSENSNVLSSSSWRPIVVVQHATEALSPFNSPCASEVAWLWLISRFPRP